jgi:predicted O-methyltransferase YrrM
LRDSVRSFLSTLTPRWAVRSARAAWILARLRRQSRTDELGLCVDASGAHVPWFTYPAIDYLASLDFSGASVFEFGCGASTLWWARRARSVTAVELDEAWLRRLETRVPGNAQLVFCPDGGRYPKVISELGRTFDVVVIDGAERHRSAQESLAFVSDGGLVILDNSDWYPNTARLLRSAGLAQIDFIGFGPLNSYCWATSLFVRPGCVWLGRHRDELAPIPGASPIPGGALDDGPT